MALAFSPVSWWMWSGKPKEPRITNGPAVNSSSEFGIWESDTLKFPLVKRVDMVSSSRRVKRKWHRGKERKIDREHDVVLVPSDGACVSESESDDSDWSIGWSEPHGPGFPSDDESDNSFAVLVPCYGRYDGLVDNAKNKTFSKTSTVVEFPDGHDGRSTNVTGFQCYESKKYVERWLSSLQNI